MAKLFIGDPSSTWREHLKTLNSESLLLILDPTDVEFGSPTRIKMLVKGKLVWERFYGSLDPLRAPHLLVSALAFAKERWGSDIDVQCFDYRPNPVLRQTVGLLSQLLAPAEIFVSAKAQINLGGFPVGPETVELPPAFPPLVRKAQHRAHWVRMLETGIPQSVDFRDVVFENCRLGTGVQITREQMQTPDFEDASHAEVLGETLFLITPRTPTEGKLSHAMSVTGTRRTVITDPGKYEHLLCSFADQEGNDFGFGKIERIDWAAKTAHVLCTAPPPAPVRLLRLGALRVDNAGIELGEVRPWEV